LDKWNKADEADVTGDDFAWDEFRDLLEIAAGFLFSLPDFDAETSVRLIIEETRHEVSLWCAADDFRWTMRLTQLKAE
jgi:hypothetical protein